MKIHLLPMGARFEYEGEVYSKTGPMMARSEAGVTRMVPRYAVLTPLDGAAPAAAPASGDLRQAFAEFYAVCQGLVPAAAQAELAAARDRFLARLP
ncbi:hypothetical protein AZSI13_10530 [Azospira sp. I13]|uniref:hypothetical protein n=1 Tax=Azospira sp. I13 TaxID=1765050 RepID=UPI000D467C9C|nr:hypothetical protein [Azospira sp. I13]GBG01726.1 hypothetical protein AZSI13_10530 [Azospira sp. I13]